MYTRGWQHPVKTTVSECSSVFGSFPSHRFLISSCLFFLLLLLFAHDCFSLHKFLFLSLNTAAVALIRFLRNRQDGTETRALHYPTESQRTVVLARDQSRCSQKSLKADANSYKISAHANRTQPLPMHANADPSASSEACLVNTFTAQLDAPEPSVLSEINGSFPDDYTGTLPLIGKHAQRMASVIQKPAA